MSKNQKLTPEEKAAKTVASHGVKRHVFNPSGVEIWTVVGVDGEYVLNPEQNICTCAQFYFKRIRGGTASCYHLEAVKLAKRNNAFITIPCHDSEISTLTSLLLG